MSRSRVLAVLGWGGLAALAIGIALTVSTPLLAGVDTPNQGVPKGSVQLTKQKQRIVVPADKTYGLWNEDKDNSGYSLGQCSITDDRGRPVRTKEPSGYTVTWGDEFGDFDYEFETGDGALTLSNCKAIGAESSVRPLTHTDPEDPFGGGSFGGFMWLAVAMIIGTQMIQLGVVMLISWLVVRWLWKPAAPPIQ